MSPRRGALFWAAVLVTAALVLAGGVLLLVRPLGADQVTLSSAADGLTPAPATEPQRDRNAVSPTPSASPVDIIDEPAPSAGLESVAGPTPRATSSAAPSPGPVPSRSDGSPDPDSAASSKPLDLPAVPALQAAVRIPTTPGDLAAARQAAQSLEGSVHVATVWIAERTLGGIDTTLAHVDVAEYRPLVPVETSDHRPLWERLVAGDVAVTHEFGARHDVPLGGLLATDLSTVLGEPHLLRVGAFATTGTPPIADAVVVTDTLPDAGSPVVLVALDQATSREAAVDALTGQGFSAEEIADPRAPRSPTVVPAASITPDNVWDHLALCESSGDWHINTGNGYYGGIQFLPESWALVGGTGLPHEHTREEQIYRGTLLWQIQGWEAWPQCARRLGLIVDAPAQPSPTPVETGTAVLVED